MNIGVLLPDVHGAFFSEIVRGIDLAARAAGYHVLVSGSHSDLEETTAVLQALHGRVDGLILLTAGISTAWLRRTLPRRVPAVLLYNSGADEEHDTIQVDNRLGARLATDHLLDLGHRRIAMICGPPGNGDAAGRRLGFREALAARGLQSAPPLELPGDFGEEAGLRAGERLADLEPLPTAVFAANDGMAIGCLAALRGRGLRVPDDVSLVGFDDIPIARYLTPALTTVQVPIAGIGGRALERLVAVMQSDGQARHEVVEPTLAIRASTAAPGKPSSDPENRRRRES